MAYTKGPWKVCTSSDGFICIGHEDTREIPSAPTDFNPTIADVWHENNAKLIACAPEMAEMLLSIQSSDGYAYCNPGALTALLKKAGVIE